MRLRFHPRSRCPLSLPLAEALTCAAVFRLTHAIRLHNERTLNPRHPAGTVMSPIGHTMAQSSERGRPETHLPVTWPGRTGQCRLGWQLARLRPHAESHERSRRGSSRAIRVSTDSGGSSPRLRPHSDPLPTQCRVPRVRPPRSQPGGPPELLSGIAAY